MELNWHYAIKGQKVDGTSYQSSLAKSSSHKTLPTSIENDKAFERIMMDRKTTITHNPLQLLYSQSNIDNSLQSPHSYPNSNSAPFPTMSPNSYPNSYPISSPSINGNDNNATSEQVLSGSDTEQSQHESNLSTHSKTETQETLLEYAVVDTLTSIVNAARAKEKENQKKMTDALRSKGLHVDKAASVQSIDIDMEPSPSPQLPQL